MKASTRILRSGLPAALARAAVGLALLLCACSGAAETPPPNIVFLLADDLGYADIGSYGVRDIRTPWLDELAREGVRFTEFYSNGPSCSPTRTALITGRYQQRVGGLESAIGNGNVGRYDDAVRLRKTHDLGLPANEGSLARVLKRAGYSTAITGKWHLGYEEKFAPGHHGFDHAFYAIGGGMDYFHHVEDAAEPTALYLNGKPIVRDGYFTELVAAEAEQFIAANRARPFFLYVPFTAPHAPFQGPQDRKPQPLAKEEALWNQGKGPPAVYAAMIESLDGAIGRILAALEEHGLTGRTLVIFKSDNGGTRSARPTPLRGFKGNTFEGGIRVPCIVRWPGVLPANTTSTQVGITMDLTASMVRAAGAKLPPGFHFDGIDVLAAVAAGGPTIPRTLFWRGRRGDSTWKAVREGSLKYVIRTVGAKVEEEGLFDLDADVGERHDLLAQRPADGARLRQLLVAWEKEVAPRR